ncbi:MAG: CAP domain-containing protein [Deltaproteobacteria bacterium]|nr:CAP domain-containing protein [Deltaproteobacteria bacterium]
MTRGFGYFLAPLVRVRRLLALSLGLGLILLMTLGQGPALGERSRGSKRINSTEYGQEVLDLVNRARRSEGRSPLRWSQEVADAAQTRAMELGRKFSHTRPNGKKWNSILKEHRINSSAYGENIASGQKNPAAVMKSWLKSPGHRSNILDRDYTRLGVGVAVGPDGQLKWAQIFLE